MKKLTPKQERFCEEYLVDLNATQAAIRAGFSEKTSYSQGQRLLKNVEVQVYIREKKEELSHRTSITVDRVINEIASIAFHDKVLLMEEALKEEDKELREIKVSLVLRGIKDTDKLKANDMLMRHLGAYTDKLEVSGEIRTNTIADRLLGLSRDDS